MPIYEYQCSKCDDVFEIFHKVDEDCKVTCPKCLKPAKKIDLGNQLCPKRVRFLCERLPVKKSKGREKVGKRRGRKRTERKR